MRNILMAVVLAGCSAALDLDHDECDGAECEADGSFAEVGFGEDGAISDSAAPDARADGQPAPDQSVDGATRDRGVPGDAQRPADAGPDSGLSDRGLPPDAGGCIDPDGDGYGEGCADGPDCRENARAIHPGAPERCNGLDDDCDEIMDEGFAPGDDCSVGVGRCMRMGVLVCGIDGSRAVCSAVAGEPREESCDEVDEDCDGTVDEGVANCCDEGETQPCGVDVGACQIGVQTCVNGEYQACDGVGPAAGGL